MIDRESSTCPVCGTPSGGCSCLAGYSDGFKGLLARQNSRDLVEGSHVHDADLREWEHERRFLADAISHDGTILDIGCANGFLLRCLQEWSGRKLDPFGVDWDTDSIGAAQKLFPESPSHFAPLSIQELETRKDVGFPAQFDFVFWNVWDNFPLDRPQGVEALRVAWNAVAPGGRLILGLYDPDKEKNLRAAEILRTHGYQVGGIMEHPDGRCEVAIYLEKPPVSV